VKRVAEFLLGIPGGWVAAMVFAVSGLETAILVGTVLPGEVAIVLGGVLAALGRAPLPAVLVASVAGPIAGDLVGYFLGRRYGQEFARRKLGERRWKRAHAALTGGGWWRITLARILPFVRGVLPTTAGAVRVPPLRFFAVDLPSAAVWGAGSALAGYLVSRDFQRLLAWSHWFSIGVAALVVAAGGWWWYRRRRRPRREGGRKRVARRA
jgi:membrane-associated protein